MAWINTDPRVEPSNLIHLKLATVAVSGTINQISLPIMEWLKLKLLHMINDQFPFSK